MNAKATITVLGDLRRAAENAVRCSVGLLRDRTILALSVLFGIAAVGLVWHQLRQSSRLVESTNRRLYNPPLGTPTR